MAERSAEQVGRVVVRDVDHHRAGHGMPRHQRERIGGRGRLPAERGEQGSRILLFRQREQPAPGDAAGVEHIAGSIEEAHDTDGGAAIRGPNLIGKRAAHPPEPKQHDIGPRRPLRSAAANLRELEGAVHAARRLGGVRRGDRERNVPLGRSLRDGDDIDAAGGERGEDPCRHAGAPAMPSPTTAMTAMPPRVVTLSMSPAAISARNACRRLRTARSASGSGSVKPIELSDEAWKIVETDRRSDSMAANVRAAIPWTPIIPFPATVTIACPWTMASALTG